MGTVTQSQAIPYTGPISLLVSQLRSLTGKDPTPSGESDLGSVRVPVCVMRCVFVCSGDVEQVEAAAKITIRIFKSITLVHEAGMVLLEVRDSEKQVQTF